MNVQMVHARVKATAVTEIEAAGQRLFAALELAQPRGAFDTPPAASPTE
jgi:hypothetical protein